MANYQAYLKKVHSKFVTPNDVMLAAIKEATGQGILDKLKIIAGEANEVYDVELGDKRHVILRIARGGHKQFEQEKWATRECKRKEGIPVPEFLLIKHIYIEDSLISISVLDKIDGEPLERGGIDFNKFGEQRKRKIINQAGEILSKIHNIKTNGFGRLEGKGNGPFATFGEYMAEDINRLDEVLRIAEGTQIDASQIREALEILKYKSFQAPPLIPYLSHGDFNIKHIIINKKDKIIGIIDWGEVEGHSPINDFAKWDYWFSDSIPIDWLKEGYTNKSIFDENYDDLLHWIRLKNGLGVLGWYYQANYKWGIEKAKKELNKDLEYFKTKKLSK